MNQRLMAVSAITAPSSAAMVQFTVSQPNNSCPTSRTSAISENTDANAGHRGRMMGVTLIRLLAIYVAALKRRPPGTT